jgi:cytochrome P450
MVSASSHLEENPAHHTQFPQHHNEEEFPNSYKFEPERFMTKKPGQTDGMDNIALGEGMYGFGFGRYVFHSLFVLPLN